MTTEHTGSASDKLKALAREKAILLEDLCPDWEGVEAALLSFGAAVLDAATERTPVVTNETHPVEALRRYTERIEALKKDLMGGNEG